MTAPAGFEPTLGTPLAWIEELTGAPHDEDVALHLSYWPRFPERAAELGCTLADIEADFERGYFLKRMPAYYILESGSFKIWAQPRDGKTSGGRLVVVDKIESLPEPIAVDEATLRRVTLRPIWDEVPASAEAIWARQVAYQEACRTLELPPPIERPAATPNPDETDGLWRYAALDDLLEVLRRRSALTPPVRVLGTVLASDEATSADGDADKILRVETTDPLNGWRADMRVNGSFKERPAFSTQIRDIEAQVLELDAPDGLFPKVGAHVTIEQVTRFAMSAHQRALKQFLGREVAGSWNDLRALLAAPNELVPGEAPTSVTDPSTGERLTEEQRRAVELAVATPHAFFIQGPPGTGKTTVITEIVQRLVRRGERVLLLSSTHVAVDEVLRRIEKKSGVLPVRLSWSAAKVDQDVRAYAYENAVKGLVKKVLLRRDDAEQFWARREAESPSSPHDRIEALKRVEERWIAGGREQGAESAFEEEIGAALLEAANLICATTVGVASKKFAHLGNVDTLIVDEASRITDAEFLIGAVRARRWILVGDEHQLPPHVEPEVEYLLLAMVACSMVERKLAEDLSKAVEQLAREWEEEEKLHAFRVQSVLEIAGPLMESAEWAEHYRGPFERALGRHHQGGQVSYPELVRTIRYFFIQSLFERGVAACPEALRVRLSEQRRMIDPIARFVRVPVYRGAYVSPDAATLAKLGVAPLVCDAFPQPVTFLNTQFRGEDAAEEMIRTGFVNDLECQWIVDACDHFEEGLFRSRVAGRTTVSILCFYREQARRVRALLDGKKRAHQKLQFRVIDAIDRIQGQESDIVFISFCRARSPRRTLSPSFGMWLRDIRRLNVAFTRARRALVLVGHRPTLEKLGKYQPFYSNLFALFDQSRVDMQMIQDFGAKRRRR